MEGEEGGMEGGMEGGDGGRGGREGREGRERTLPSRQRPLHWGSQHAQWPQQSASSASPALSPTYLH